MSHLSLRLHALPWAFRLQPTFGTMQTAWDQSEDTDVERSASSIVRLPLPPPAESDDDIDLDAPTMPRAPIWNRPVALGPAVTPQLAPRWVLFALAVLGATAAALALTLALG